MEIENIDKFTYSLIKNFYQKYPEIISEMKQCDHNDSEYCVFSDWHLEGDVWTHTMMVVSHLKRLVKYSNNPFELIVAGLLHDIGKPLSREFKEDKNKITFYGHSGVSTFIAAGIIKKLVPNFTHDQVIYVLRLINYHQVLFDIRDDSSYISIKKFEEKFNSMQGVELLHDVNLLRIADTRGHISSYSATHSEKIKEILGRLATKYYPRYSSRYNESKPEAVIMVGIPGCGKSTYIKKYLSDHIVVSRDNQFQKLYPNLSYSDAWNIADQEEISKMFQNDLSEAIKSNNNIVLDLTNLTHKWRMKFINTLKSKFSIKIIVLMPDFNIVKQRNFNRIGKVIPENVVLNMMKSFQLPFENETNHENIKYIFNF